MLAPPTAWLGHENAGAKSHTLTAASFVPLNSQKAPQTGSLVERVGDTGFLAALRAKLQRHAAEGENAGLLALDGSHRDQSHRLRPELDLWLTRKPSPDSSVAPLDGTLRVADNTPLGARRTHCGSDSTEDRAR